MYNETEYLRSLPLSDRIVVLREKALRLQAENDALDAAANPPCPDHEDQRLPDLFECPKCLDSASEEFARRLGFPVDERTCSTDEF
jgi:hypothetical protein